MFQNRLFKFLITKKLFTSNSKNNPYDLYSIFSADFESQNFVFTFNS